MAGRSPKNRKGAVSPKNKKATTYRGGAGPLVRDRKEAVQKGVSAARRARGDHPR